MERSVWRLVYPPLPISGYTRSPKFDSECAPDEHPASVVSGDVAPASAGLCSATNCAAAPESTAESSDVLGVDRALAEPTSTIAQTRLRTAASAPSFDDVFTILSPLTPTT